MTRIATLPLALMLLTTALAGCLDGAEPIDTSELDENTSQNSSDIATLNEDIEAISDILDADLALIEALDTRMDALVNESEDNTTNAQIAELQEELDTIIDILDADLLLIEALEANLSAGADDLNAAATNISTVTADLNAVETQLAALDARVTTLETAVTNINQMLDQHTTQIALLEAEHAADIQALEEDLTNVNSCYLVSYGKCEDAEMGGTPRSRPRSRFTTPSPRPQSSVCPTNYARKKCSLASWSCQVKASSPTARGSFLTGVWPGWPTSKHQAIYCSVTPCPPPGPRKFRRPRSFPRTLTRAPCRGSSTSERTSAGTSRPTRVTCRLTGGICGLSCRHLPGFRKRTRFSQ